MNQLTFGDMKYSGRKKVTQKEKFLRLMNRIVPWDEWVKKIQSFYPSGKRGRPPRGIEVMLRMYLLQIWFNLSDTGLEDAIYDIYAFQRFIGINFLEEQVPDATTLLKFRHLLEEHDLGKALFDDIKERLDRAGLMMHGGTIVDCLLHYSVHNGGNPELSHSSIRLRYLFPSYRCRFVLPAQNILPQFFAVFLEPWERLLYDHAVYSRCSFVLPDPLVRIVQIIFVQYRLKQSGMSAFRFSAIRSNGTVRSCFPFAFRAISPQAAIVFNVFCL